MMIAAAVSAALPDVVSSCAATTSAMPYASRNFVAHVAGREAELISSSQPTWINEVFSDIEAPNSFLDWESQLNVASRPSLFSQALDLFTADAMRIFSYASHTFSPNSQESDATILVGDASLPDLVPDLAPRGTHESTTLLLPARGSEQGTDSAALTTELTEPGSKTRSWRPNLYRTPWCSRSPKTETTNPQSSDDEQPRESV